MVRTASKIGTRSCGCTQLWHGASRKHDERSVCGHAVAWRRTEGDGCARESSRAGDAPDLATVLTHLRRHCRHLSRAVCAQPNTILGSVRELRLWHSQDETTGRAESRMCRLPFSYARQLQVARFGAQASQPTGATSIKEKTTRPEERGARRGGHSQPAPGAPWLICAPVIVQPRGSSV